MGDVPAAIQILEIAVRKRELVPGEQAFQALQCGFGQVPAKGLCEARLTCEIGLTIFQKIPLYSVFYGEELYSYIDIL